MRLLFIILLLPCLLYGQRVRGIDLTSTAKDTIRSITGDSSAVMRTWAQGQIEDSTATWSDTTDMKLSDSEKGYLRQLSSTNPNGGGWYVKVDSVYTENGSGVAFDHATSGQQFVNEYFLNTGIVTMDMCGAYADCTNALNNHTQGNKLLDFSYSVSSASPAPVYIPAGQYLTKPSGYVDKTWEGWEVHPNQEIFGAWKATKVYTDSSSGYIFNADSAAMRAADWNDRNAYLHDFAVYGDTSFIIGSGAGSKISGGGIDLRWPSDTKLNHIRYERIFAEKFGGEALTIKDARFWEFIDCEVRNSSFTSYTGTGLSGRFVGCKADSVGFGMESFLYPQSASGTMDSSSRGFYSDFEFKNIARYGLAVYSADQLEISDFSITRPTTTKFDTTTTSAGIYLKPHSRNGRDGFESVIIRDGIIDSSSSYGIQIGSLADTTFTDTTVNNIEINSVTITNSYNNAIKIDYNRDAFSGGSIDTTITNSVTIKNCNLNNNNAGNLNGLVNAQVHIQGVDAVVYKNNTSHNDDRTTATARAPLYLEQCDSAKVTGNTFDSQDRSTTYIVYYDSTSTGIHVSNNTGLDLDGGVSKYNPGAATYEAYYQASHSDNSGLYVGGAESGTGFKLEEINDIASLISYNTSGSPTDTVELSTTLDLMYGVYAFADSNITIALTQNQYAWLTNSDSTLWQTPGSQYRTNTTFGGDTIVFGIDGIVDISGYIILRQDGADSTELEIYPFLNDVAQNSAKILVTLEDSAWHTFVLPLGLLDITANDNYRIKFRNITNNNDIQVKSARYVWKKIN